MTTMTSEQIVDLVRSCARVARGLADEEPDDEVTNSVAAALETLLTEIED